MGKIEDQAGSSNRPPGYDPSPSYDAEASSPQISPGAHPVESPLANYQIFPRDIVFYRAEYISLFIGPQYEADKPRPNPLFHVSVHLDDKNLTNQTAVPQIRLHCGPDNTYPVIGSALFRATTTSDIVIWPNYNSNTLSNEVDNPHARTEIEVSKTGPLTTGTHSFYHVTPPKDGIQTREKYEWKFSGDPQVKALATENFPGEDISQQKRGLKLVRKSTGAVVAVWAGGVHNRLYNPKKVAGKMRFVEEGATDELRLLAVMSMLSIVERSRRNAVRNANSGWCVFQ